MDNGFDDFDGFDNFDDAGFNSNSGGSNSNEFDFGEDWDFDSSSDSIDDNEQSDTGQFDGAFDTDTGGDNIDSNDSSSGVKKQSIILIAVGIIGVIIVIFIATNLINKPSKGTISNNQVNTQSQTNNNKVSNNTPGTNSNTANTNNYNSENNEFNWVGITNNEDIQINNNTNDMVFTVTSIEHQARTVDTKGNLVVKTRLLGSISGMTGIYELNIPYNKGTKLVVGDSFTVKVQLGTFKDKTVILDIIY